MLHETVDEDLRMDVRAALSAWLAKEAEVDAFVRWLASQAVPQECAGILSWLLSSPEVAFAAYNVYLRKQARVAAAQAAGLNAQVRNIAGDLAAQIKPEK
ncbi:hypothetical protein GX586_16035 [bacterium]|nr:hypothetical protein [bacterium]